MSNKTVSNLGLIGVSLLIFTLIFGGLLIENYDITNQFISESYAIDTKHGVSLRLLGYIPSGIIIALFCFLGEKYLDPKLVVKIGFYGIGIFYGLGTTVTGIFPCDSGCNKELLNLSSSQIIHNIAALLMYLFVPFLIILIGLAIRKTRHWFSIQSVILGLSSSILVYLFGSDLLGKYVGLYQRIIEIIFALWIILCSVEIKKRPY
ncbi:DUF998 domain-containing protein [Bacteroidota bacterium]|nr:DUF998 domain-containing protein [Bacteroidota bacterium]